VKGTVSAFWPHKHYGFIAEGNTYREIFFHQNNLAPDSSIPAKGHAVIYEVSEFNGRPVAINVRVVSGKAGS